MVTCLTGATTFGIVELAPRAPTSTSIPGGRAASGEETGGGAAIRGVTGGRAASMGVAGGRVACRGVTGGRVACRGVTGGRVACRGVTGRVGHRRGAGNTFVSLVSEFQHWLKRIQWREATSLLETI
jgi:hypothetical protein